MVFSSAEFLFLILPVAAVVYYLPICRNIKFRNIWLLFVSLVFYAWGEPTYVLVMVCSIIVNWLFGFLLTGRQGSPSGKRVVALAVIYNIGILFILKYVSWILGFAGVIIAEGSILSKISLPIGISFYTFQALSYVIDVYRKKVEPEKNILNVGLYIAFFPQLIAGPIVKYEDIAKQIKDRVHNWDKFYAGVWRFAVGLAKKMLLANQIAVLAELAFEADERSVLFAWLGAVAYALQIYFDFSGYSDMAIGLAKMFGFELKENFNYPYMSRSVTEFWKRWHISLTTWFREYVYIPLGGNRCGKVRWLFNFFIVWLLTGVWHGAAWAFIAWGLAQGLVIAIERIGHPLERKGWKAVLGFVFTVLFTILSWTMFNTGSFTGALSYYASMFGLVGNAVIDSIGIYWLGQFKILLIAGILFSFPWIEWINKKLEGGLAIAEGGKKKVLTITTYTWNTCRMLVLIIFFVFCCAQAIAGDYNPFIYFNF